MEKSSMKQLHVEVEQSKTSDMAEPQEKEASSNAELSKDNGQIKQTASSTSEGKEAISNPELSKDNEQIKQTDLSASEGNVPDKTSSISFQGTEAGARRRSSYHLAKDGSIEEYTWSDDEDETNKLRKRVSAFHLTDDGHIEEVVMSYDEDDENDHADVEVYASLPDTYDGKRIIIPAADSDKEKTANVKESVSFIHLTDRGALEEVKLPCEEEFNPELSAPHHFAADGSIEKINLSDEDFDEDSD